MAVRFGAIRFWSANKRVVVREKTDKEKTRRLLRKESARADDKAGDGIVDEAGSGSGTGEH
jgi:hypothetical protein